MPCGSMLLPLHMHQGGNAVYTLQMSQNVLDSPRFLSVGSIILLLMVQNNDLTQAYLMQLMNFESTNETDSS